jgi:predicted metal-dependent peptidase
MTDDNRPYELTEVRYKAHRLMPYLGKMTWNLVPVEVPGLGTMAVDQWARLYYDPEVFSMWSLRECAAVVLHEVMHVVLQHAKRAKMYLGENATEHHRYLWNVAVDLVVNQTLRDAVCKPNGKKIETIEFPEGAIFPEKYDLPLNLTAPEYYVLLEEQEEEEQQQGQQPKKPDEEGETEAPYGNPTEPSEEGDEEGEGESGGSPQDTEGEGPEAGEESGEEEPSDSGSDSGSDGKPWNGDPPQFGGSGADGEQKPWELGEPDDDSPGMDEFTQKRLERQIAKETKDFGEKHRGDVPGNLDRWTKEILEPKVDPVRELMASVKYAINSIHGFGDYTFKRRNPRQPAGSLRMPAHRQPIPRVTIIADTSGSMSSEDLGFALGVIAKVTRGLPNDGVRVIAGDTTMQEVNTVFRAEQVQLAGGGGTNMGRIMLQAVNEDTVKPDVIVVCTDCYTPWPNEREMPVKVVVCSTSENMVESVPKWMKAVYIGR